MSKCLMVLCTASLIMVLFGCNETKSEAWYKQHPDETYTVFTQCLKNGETSDNCQFARRAAIMFTQTGAPNIQKKFADIFHQKTVKSNTATE